MNDDENSSYLIKKRDYADIIKLQDVGALDEFFDEPRAFIVESVMGSIDMGRKEWMAFGTRIVQGAFKAQMFKQVSFEFRKLREKGRLANDFAEKPNGFQTWVELMTIIDEDRPDVDRLEALKAMFFAVNKVGASDADRIVAYQLWQIAKRLTSGELLILKTAYEHRSEYTKNTISGFRQWAEQIARDAGHNVVGLVILHEKKLFELGLLSDRYHEDRSGINPTDARLTDLGLQFCSNLETYSIEVSNLESPQSRHG